MFAYGQSLRPSSDLWIRRRGFPCGLNQQACSQRHSVSVSSFVGTRLAGRQDDPNRGNTSAIKDASIDSPTTVLCIDDNETALKIRKMILEVAGYSVLTAIDAESAMQLFTTTPVDMVISDHLLQGKTGTELAAEMKRVKPTIPIIIMSGMVEQPEGIEHADLFIGKGESPPIWLKKISDVLQKSRCQ
jgi:CheY-like chemotaxis protein